MTDLNALSKDVARRTTYDAMVNRLDQYGYVPEGTYTLSGDIKVFCPLHETMGDHDPSLHINIKDGSKTEGQAHCFGPCTDKAIWAALMADEPLKICRSKILKGSAHHLTGGRGLISLFEIESVEDYVRYNSQFMWSDIEIQEATYFYRDRQGRVNWAKVAFRSEVQKLFYWCKVMDTTLHGEPLFLKRWKLAGETPPLYGVWTVDQPAGSDNVLWAVEGEKDVDRLHALGERAVSIHAAGTLSSVVEDLAGQTIVIVPDNDEAGGSTARNFARACARLGSGTVVKIVELPPLGTARPNSDKSDISDWLNDGGSLDILKIIAADEAEVVGLHRTEPEAESKVVELTEAVEDDPDFRNAVEHEKFRARVFEQAKRERDAENTAPPSILEGTFSLAEDESRVREERQYYFDGLLSEGHNVTMAGMKKAGKSTFISNLVKALSDREAFLGKFEPGLAMTGRIGVWNCEMPSDDYTDYIRALQVKAKGQSSARHFRDEKWKPNLLNHVAMEWTVKWLNHFDIEFWIIDPWGLICSWAGVDENDNTGVRQLTTALDLIKASTGVRAIFMPTHPPRSADGSEGAGRVRSRGASVLEEWPDELWAYSRSDDEVRSLYVEGRGVELEDTTLNFDRASGLLSVNGASRRTLKNDSLTEEILQIIARDPGVNTTNLRAALTVNTENATGVIRKMVSDGLIHYKDGPRNAKFYFMGPDADRVTAATGWEAAGL